MANEADDALTEKEARALVKMGDPRTFAEFRKRQPLFPRPYSIGMTKNNKPILRFSKKAIDEFIVAMKVLGQQAEPQEDDEPPEEDE